jgi:hypothetical protein
VIVITGMHRSGTSLVSMVLDALGVDFGDHSLFYAADQWNEEGYFERRDVVDLNSRLITGFNRTTGPLSSAMSQVGYLLWGTQRGSARRAERLEKEIDVLAAELKQLAVKDPRFCLTLQAWAPYIDDCVVCLRPPDEVALSLNRRQRIPIPVGFRFWERHARGLLDNVPSGSLFVDFGRLAGPEPMSELVRIDRHFGLQLDDDQLRRRFGERFEPRLRNFGGEGLSLPDRTRDLWNALQERRRSQ